MLLIKHRAIQQLIPIALVKAHTHLVLALKAQPRKTMTISVHEPIPRKIRPKTEEYKVSIHLKKINNGRLLPTESL